MQLGWPTCTTPTRVAGQAIPAAAASPWRLPSSPFPDPPPALSTANHVRPLAAVVRRPARAVLAGARRPQGGDGALAQDGLERQGACGLRARPSPSRSHAGPPGRGTRADRPALDDGQTFDLKVPDQDRCVPSRPAAGLEVESRADRQLPPPLASRLCLRVVLPLVRPPAASMTSRCVAGLFSRRRNCGPGRKRRRSWLPSTRPSPRGSCSPAARGTLRRTADLTLAAFPPSGRSSSGRSPRSRLSARRSLACPSSRRTTRWSSPTSSPNRERSS